jgi:hypothetical protein
MSKHPGTFKIDQPIALARAAPILARKDRDWRSPRLELVASEGRLLKPVTVPSTIASEGLSGGDIRLTLLDFAAMAFVFLSVASGPALVWLLLWLAS